jgi:dihydroorotate dehydrogenase (fumarate)/dihydropyrimidine dehydrogenase (NAD+) subunit PreA
MKGQHKEGIQIGQDAQFASEVIKTVTDAVSIPIVAKLTPQVNDLAEMARLMKTNGAAGVTVSNRYVGFAVDIDTAKPQLSGWAGVGGPWMKPLTLRWISKLHYEMEKLPISGSNGIFDWRDVVEFLMSGATAVQICSVLLVKGFDYIQDVVTGLERFLAEKGYGSVKEIIGIAARSALHHDEILKLGRFRSTIDEQKCISCGKCVTSCMFGAIEALDDRYIVNDRCAGCELCFSICPSDAIRFVPMTSVR